MLSSLSFASLSFASLSFASLRLEVDRKLEVHVNGGYSYDATHAGPSQQTRSPAGRRKGKSLVS